MIEVFSYSALSVCAPSQTGQYIYPSLYPSLYPSPKFLFLQAWPDFLRSNNSTPKISRFAGLYVGPGSISGGDRLRVSPACIWIKV